MKNIVRVTIFRIIAAITFALPMCVPAFAASSNPPMGDTQGRYIGVVIAIAAVALVTVIVIVAISAKKKR